MFERFIEAIGRFISSLFNKSGNLIDDTRVEANLLKQQVKTAAVNTKSNLAVSVSGAGHENYFQNRVIGEFLRLMASLVPYKYYESSDQYVAYFVRQRKRNSMEYIKFTKQRETDKVAQISYTCINKLISPSGITLELGSTDKKVLLVDENLSNTIYSALSGTTAPFYLVHILNDVVGVGNPVFMHDCWITTVKLLSRRVDKYLAGEDQRLTSTIDTLVSQAGAHMFMSYFRSLDNPFYKTFYKKASINTIVEAVKQYNQSIFNVNKILNFTFDRNQKNKGSVDTSKGTSFSLFQIYGVTVKFTGEISEVGEAATSRFNYKLADSLLKSQDNVLKKNFLFYMFSTGGVDDKDIIALKEEEYFKECTSTDNSIISVNNRVEPTVDTVMKESGFKENEDGDLASRDFESQVEQHIIAVTRTDDIEYPTVNDDILVVPVIAEESPIVKPVEHFTTDIPSDKPAVVSNTGSVVDKLREQAEEIDDKPVSRNLATLPITQWTKDDCVSMLQADTLANENLTRADILDRLLFLNEHAEQETL